MRPGLFICGMKTFLNWSGGKDSALALRTALRQGLQIDALVTTLSAATGRVTMHGVRRELLEAQAHALQLPIRFIELPEGGDLAAYEEAIAASNAGLLAEGFGQVVSGDLFLDDLRQYREKLYGRDGLRTLFPLWGCNTTELLRRFSALSFRAVLVAADSRRLGENFCGRELDASLLSLFPQDVDPCGENGEYHSFVYDGPLFTEPVRFARGEKLYREYPAPKQEGGDCFTAPQPAAGFWFCDLLPL